MNYWAPGLCLHVANNEINSKEKRDIAPLIAHYITALGNSETLSGNPNSYRLPIQ